MFIGLLTSVVVVPNNTKFMLLSNQKSMNEPTFINFHPSAYKNYTTIHLRLIQIDLLEALILLMTYLIKYVFQKKETI